MRYAVAVVLLALIRPAVADPLCAAVFVTAGGSTWPVDPECGEVPLATYCQDETVRVVGTGVEVRVVVCVPI